MHEQAKNRPAVLLQEFADLTLYRFVHVARTHFVASSVNFADALRAVRFRRLQPQQRLGAGKVAAASSFRRRETNFAPSGAIDWTTTFRPRSVEASGNLLDSAFAFCSSAAQNADFHGQGQNSRPSFCEEVPPLVLRWSAPRAATISATSRHARMPSFSGRWPRMVSPAPPRRPSAILSSRMSWPMYLKPTGVWKVVCPWDFAAASADHHLRRLRRCEPPASSSRAIRREIVCYTRARM